jgi:hypothetical protein
MPYPHDPGELVTMLECKYVDHYRARARHFKELAENSSSPEAWYALKGLALRYGQLADYVAKQAEQRAWR